MAKEILLYGDINSYSVPEFIDKINELEQEDLVVRINSNGGSVEYGWGAIAKFKEFAGNKIIKVDGKAHSMALFFLAYADNAEALDVSEFLLHRAAYSEWVEKDAQLFDDETKANLTRINASLQRAFENKIDVAKFEELKGVKLKDIFTLDGRKEVYLTAQEAKKIGLISKINKITPDKKAEIASYMEIAAKSNGVIKSEVQNLKIDKKMTLEELKNSHPEVFAEAKKLGASEEKERVSAWLVFADADIKAVTEGIEKGEQLTVKAMAELNRKALGLELAAKAETEKTPAVPTTPVAEEKTAKQKELEAFEAEVNNTLKIK